MLARDLYLQSVKADPKYAPAWARLGRAYRYMGKFVEDFSENLVCEEAAFQTAFKLNPNLAIAHNFYTSFEADSGRSLDSMERLLKRAQTHRNDPNLLSGLVHACRYCGLLEASLAAHDHAVRLDPHIRTSVGFTYLRLNDFQKAIDHSNGPIGGFLEVPALMALGREQEALAFWRQTEKTASGRYLSWCVLHRAFVEGDRRKSLAALDRALDQLPFLGVDPESRYSTAIFLAKLCDTERALEFLSLALDKGYRCHYALLHDPWLDSLRSHHRFMELVNRAAEMRLQARTAFLDNQGDRLLGVQGESR